MNFSPAAGYQRGTAEAVASPVAPHGQWWRRKSDGHRPRSARSGRVVHDCHLLSPTAPHAAQRASEQQQQPLRARGVTRGTESPRAGRFGRSSLVRRCSLTVSEDGQRWPTHRIFCAPLRTTRVDRGCDGAVLPQKYVSVRTTLSHEEGCLK